MWLCTCPATKTKNYKQTAKQNKKNKTNKQKTTSADWCSLESPKCIFFALKIADSIICHYHKMKKFILLT